MGRNGVLGIIVPIFEDEVMHDIFHGKSVYAGLAAREETELEKGDRIFFYDSAETHDLEGEAVITDVSFEPASKVLGIDERELFQERARFSRYVSSLPNGDASTLRVIRFKEPTVFAQPVKCSIAITDQGLYMTADIFSKIAKENR